MQKLTLSVLNCAHAPGQSFHEWHFFDQLAPFLIIVDHSSNMHNTTSFLILLSFSKRWVHLNAVSRQIFGDIQETQFSGSKMGVHVHLKNAFPGGIGNQG